LSSSFAFPHQNTACISIIPHITCLAHWSPK
jgi:hypothetical protein